MSALDRCLDERRQIVQDMQSGVMGLEDGTAAWCRLVREAAVSVFGVSRGGPSRTGDGRKANPWFKHCRSEWYALQIAIGQQVSHAAAAAWRAFNKAKRKLSATMIGCGRLGC